LLKGGVARRVFIYGVSVVALLAVLYPLRWDRHEDNFPLSNYPMFSKAKSKPTLGINYAFGVDSEGNRVYFPPSYVGNFEVLQARAIYERQFSKGKQGTDELCRKIVESIHEHDDPDMAKVVEVKILRGNYDAVGFLTGKNTTGRERFYNHCRTNRGEP
jgi:hypothetical protein